MRCEAMGLLGEGWNRTDARCTLLGVRWLVYMMLMDHNVFGLLYTHKTARTRVGVANYPASLSRRRVSMPQQSD